MSYCNHMICHHIKYGEFNPLWCCLEKGHAGEHCYVVKEEPRTNKQGEQDVSAKEKLYRVEGYVVIAAHDELTAISKAQRVFNSEPVLWFDVNSTTQVRQDDPFLTREIGSYIMKYSDKFSWPDEGGKDGEGN